MAQTDGLDYFRAVKHFFNDITYFKHFTSHKPAVSRYHHGHPATRPTISLFRYESVRACTVCIKTNNSWWIGESSLNHAS